MIELSTLQVAVFKCGYVMRRTAQNCNRRFRLAFTQKLLSSLAVLSKLCGGTAHHDKSPSLKNPISMTIRAWIQWRRRGEGGKPRHCIAGYSLRLIVPEQRKREKAKTHVSVVWGADADAGARGWTLSLRFSRYGLPKFLLPPCELR